ncbi:MAG: Na+/H+ antiporter NhaC family protein [Ignavibacteriae bacterium]|nr:Na+/H+ antiporter NhaC family protein [Ignavibacteriota bacterium]NOG97408.1 Na+/H+ antiporter NhaC family protein [Ignavibacteriota bacterium]
MIKKYLILLFLFISTAVSAQQISIPKFTLTGINFELSLSDIPDSIKQVDLKVQNSSHTSSYLVQVRDGKVDTTLNISSFGNYIIHAKNIKVKPAEIRVIPGWFSILPPLIAILMALLIRQVLVSLALGIYIGTIFIYDYNPLTALLRFADVFIIEALIDRDHMYVILFTLLIGGVVGIIARNGGTIGLANLVTKYAKTPKSGMITSWLMGLMIFFDDYANSLIIGNMMRPITDKLKISREKLAYIVDSTAAPIASVVIVSTWIGYELGLISEGLKLIGSTENAYDVFIQTLPYRFYPIAALFFVFITSYFQRDFGPMYKAEKRARVEGKLYRDGSKISIKKDVDLALDNQKARWVNGVVPILIILFGTIGGLFYTGINSLQQNGITEYSLQQIISSSDSFSSLLWSSFVACLAAISMTVSQKVLNLHDSIGAWHKGVQSMLFACIILTFAWAISTVTNELNTADYIISILSDSLNARFLPFLVFILCGLISFATGTSWGTMAIVMPIVIPLAAKLAEYSNLDASGTSLIIYGVISSVLVGSVFGDHCSPIADTTILSSMASHCDHIDHVKTQMPYALLIGIVCIFLGDLPTAFGLNPFISIFLIFAVLTGILFLFGKTTLFSKAD